MPYLEGITHASDEAQLRIQKRIHEGYIKELADAYIRVAKINKYLIIVAPTYGVEDLDEAEQILITLSNARNNNDKTIELALDLLDHDRKVKTNG